MVAFPLTKKIENYVVTTKLIGIFLDTSLAGHQELTYSIPMVHFSRPCLVETFRSCIHGVYKLRAKHAAKKENISTKSVHNKGKYKLLIQFPRTSGGKADFSPRQPHHPRVQIETLTQKTHSTTMGRGPQSWASRRTGPRKITGTSVHTKKKKERKRRGQQQEPIPAHKTQIQLEYRHVCTHCYTLCIIFIIFKARQTKYFITLFRNRQKLADREGG